jgi:hypothetical protein
MTHEMAVDSIKTTKVNSSRNGEELEEKNSFFFQKQKARFRKILKWNYLIFIIYCDFKLKTLAYLNAVIVLLNFTISLA